MTLFITAESGYTREALTQAIKDVSKIHFSYLPKLNLFARILDGVKSVEFKLAEAESNVLIAYLNAFSHVQTLTITTAIKLDASVLDRVSQMKNLKNISLNVTNACSNVIDFIPVQIESLTLWSSRQKNSISGSINRFQRLKSLAVDTTITVFIGDTIDTLESLKVFLNNIGILQKCKNLYKLKCSNFPRYMPPGVGILTLISHNHIPEDAVVNTSIRKVLLSSRPFDGALLNRDMWAKFLKSSTELKAIYARKIADMYAEDVAWLREKCNERNIEFYLD